MTTPDPARLREIAGTWPVSAEVAAGIQVLLDRQRELEAENVHLLAVRVELTGRIAALRQALQEKNDA